MTQPTKPTQAALRAARVCQKMTPDMTLPVSLFAQIIDYSTGLPELLAALRKIEKWFGEFPESGQTWNDGSPMSYGAAYGTDGERDFMRGIAREVLARHTTDKEER